MAKIRVNDMAEMGQVRHTLLFFSMISPLFPTMKITLFLT